MHPGHADLRPTNMTTSDSAALEANITIVHPLALCFDISSGTEIAADALAIEDCDWATF
jgi:hypothetical protein